LIAWVAFSILGLQLGSALRGPTLSLLLGQTYEKINKEIGGTKG